MDNIRNFCIIAHIDHGKSTLADRFLEVTGTVEARRMKAQYLDQLELERERGITIKMAPVRMNYTLNSKLYTLNLIDTPGHSDFSYEVSRALQAVEGAILLVDATQGIQAQTLSNLRAAEAAGLKILGAVNKVDLFKNEKERLNTVIREVAELLNVAVEEIFLVSGKTGEGVEKILEAIIKLVPSPVGLAALFEKSVSETERAGLPEGQSEVESQAGERHAGSRDPVFSKIKPIARALIFDSFYDDHKGVVASVRVIDGEFKRENTIHLIAGEATSKIKEVGFFSPELKTGEILGAGEIGYIATGIKDPLKIKIGDTIFTSHKSQVLNYKSLTLQGYKEPKPVVFVSFYPEDADDYEFLERGLQKLRLNDSALTILPDQNEVLGRGFKIGFLGRLHFEIIAERLKREFTLSIVNTFPSVAYRIKTPARADGKAGFKEIIKPEDLPAEAEEIWEPMVRVEIIIPANFFNNFFPLQQLFRMSDIKNSTFLERMRINALMPLAELVSDFDDKLKSVTQGYASFSYEPAEYKKADIVRVDIMVAGTVVPGMSRFLPKASFEGEARMMVKKLKELLPHQQFAQAIQAAAGGRIIAREDIPALRKDVTGYLYGGDRTRKMKLWQKQKRGKKRLGARAEAKIPPEVFRELLKK